MRGFRTAALSVFCCLIGMIGCVEDRPPSQAAPLPQLDRADGRILWQGVSFCADCRSIETHLSLERSGSARRYVLTEIYTAAEDRVRFTEMGDWSREKNIIRLQGDQGSRRLYSLLSNGNLQPRDAAGKPFGDREQDVLIAIATTSPP